MIGTMVHYRPTPSQRERWSRRQHFGRELSDAEPVAAVVVGQGEGDVVNLRVFTDGELTPCVRGVRHGSKPGTWQPIAEAFDVDELAPEPQE